MALAELIDTSQADIVLTESFSTVKHTYKRAFLIAYSSYGTAVRAAREAGCSPESHNLWLKNDPVYAEAFEDAKQAFRDKVEERIIRRAGITEDEEHPSDLMLIFTGKKHIPEYRDNPPALTLNDNSIHITISYNRVDPRLTAPSDPQLPSPDASTTTAE